MPIMKNLGPWRRIAQIFFVLAITVSARPAAADLVVSQLIVDLSPTRRTADVEIHNDSKERSFILIEPSEILAAGTIAEKRVAKRNPKDLGLLVSSQRLVLEPGQRRMIRVAMIGPPAHQERVYRIAVTPVVGDVAAPASGLKVLVGYDMLVLARPAIEIPSLSARREGKNLTLTNSGNASVELTDGENCRLKTSCDPLPGKRLYAGASWTQTVGQGGTVRYKFRSAGKWSSVSY